MSIVVAEEGNRRVGDMSRGEIAQSVLDIKAFFSRQGGKTMKLENGATSVDTQRLEKAIDTQLPLALSVLVGEVNGGLYFMERKQFSTEEIIDKTSELDRSKKWKNGLIPFCGDDSSVLVVDTRDGDAVYEYDLDEGLGDRLASNFVRFLENYRNDLLSGRFEFLDDCGVIEKMGKSRK